MTLNVSNEYTLGGSLALDFELSVEAAGATILGGYSVGFRSKTTLTVTNGDTTSYTGIIGSIPAETFADNQYNFGLFTYV